MKKLILIFFLVINIVSLAQPNIDSLMITLKNKNLHDTTKVRILSMIGLIKPDYRMQYWDSIASLCQAALSKTKNKDVIAKLNWTYAGALNNIGFIHNSVGDIDTAIFYFEASLNLKVQINDSMGIAQSYNNLGLIYDNKGNIPVALNFHQQSLQLREALNDVSGQAESWNNIAYIQLVQEDTLKAIEYYNKSLLFHQQTNDQQGIANVYTNLGHIYRYQGKRDSSLHLFTKSLILFNKSGDVWGVAKANNNIGLLFNDNFEGDSALHYFNKALLIQTEINDPEGACFSRINIAKVLIHNSKIDDALMLVSKSLEQATILGFPDIIEKASKLRYQILKKLGKFDLALTMYELNIQMRDSIKNEANQKAAIRQQTKYEFEKEQLIKEQKLKEESRKLKKETERRDNIQYSVIFIAILAVFGTILSLGFIKVSPQFAEGLIFFAFLIFFEFCLVLLDPYVDKYSGGEPAYKLLFNALLAGFIFPMHTFFERILKIKLVKNKIE